MSDTNELGTILITGATGFVGNHLCSNLSQRGAQVLAATRTGSVGLLPEAIRRVELERSSAPERWRCALRGCAGVVHLAARVHRIGPASRRQSDYDDINVEFSQFVARQAIAAGVPRFVFLSSIKVNGEGQVRPYNSGDGANPQDAYARSKWAAEQGLRTVCAEGRMELVIIRPPVVYGPGVRANFRRLLQLTDLNIPLPFLSIANRRSFIGVQNLVDFIGTCLWHPLATQRVWLVADGEDLSTPELVFRLAALMHRRARMFAVPPVWMKKISRPLGLRAVVDRLCDSLCVDSSDARRCLNWQPSVGVNEGLASTVAAYIAGRRS